MKLNILPIFCMVYFLLGCANNKCKPNEFENHFVYKDKKLPFIFLLKKGKEEVVATNGDTETVKGFDSCAPQQTIYLYQRTKKTQDSSIKNGFLKTFYANGKLRSLTYYLNDKQVGLGKYYYPNGNLATQGFSINGESVGAQELYDSSGHLSRVLFPNHDSDFWLITHYDKEGNIDSIKGWPFCIRGHIKTKMKAGEKFKNILIEVPNLKNVSVLLNVGIYRDSKKIFDTTFVKFHKLYNGNFISLNYRFDSNAKGKYELKIVSQLTDRSSQQLLIVDTFKRMITVL